MAYCWILIDCQSAEELIKKLPRKIWAHKKLSTHRTDNRFTRRTEPAPKCLHCRWTELPMFSVVVLQSKSFVDGLLCSKPRAEPTDDQTINIRRLCEFNFPFKPILRIYFFKNVTRPKHNLGKIFEYISSAMYAANINSY